jgi:hypothetical protein
VNLYVPCVAGSVRRWHDTGCETCQMPMDLSQQVGRPISLAAKNLSAHLCCDLATGGARSKLIPSLFGSVALQMVMPQAVESVYHAHHGTASGQPNSCSHFRHFFLVCCFFHRPKGATRSRPLSSRRRSGSSAGVSPGVSSDSPGMLVSASRPLARCVSTVAA